MDEDYQGDIYFNLITNLPMYISSGLDGSSPLFETNDSNVFYPSDFLKSLVFLFITSEINLETSKLFDLINFFAAMIIKNANILIDPKTSFQESALYLFFNLFIEGVEESTDMNQKEISLDRISILLIQIESKTFGQLDEKLYKYMVKCIQLFRNENSLD